MTWQCNSVPEHSPVVNTVQKSVKVTVVGSGNSIDKGIVGSLSGKRKSENEGHQTGLCDRGQEEESVELAGDTGLREVMRNNSRQLGIQEFPLKGLLCFSEMVKGKRFFYIIYERYRWLTLMHVVCCCLFV